MSSLFFPTVYKTAINNADASSYPSSTGVASSSAVTVAVTVPSVLLLLVVMLLCTALIVVVLVRRRRRTKQHQLQSASNNTGQYIVCTVSTFSNYIIIVRGNSNNTVSYTNSGMDNIYSTLNTVRIHCTLYIAAAAVFTD